MTTSDQPVGTVAGEYISSVTVGWHLDAASAEARGSKQWLVERSSTFPPGATSASAPNWVSKSDLTRYLRCPYAFYLLDRGLVRFEDTVNEQQAQLIEQGVDFQAAIEATAVPRAIELHDLPRLLAEESIRLFGVPVFRNAKLGICGKPDAIDTAQGALFPVEVKSHKDVQRTDELELAFYWMLLEPYRTRSASPRGYLLLRRDGAQEQVEVEIRPHRFQQVHQLLEEVRSARANGVRPRICGCTLCSGIMRDEIRKITRDNKDLTLIWDIGPVRARCLEWMGINTYEELVAADSDGIIEALRQQSCYVSATQVALWKHHARSYCACEPVMFGDPLPCNGSFIALDLEYLSPPCEPLIWLVGVCLVNQGRREYLALWADTQEEQKQNLIRLAELAGNNSSAHVVTWNGNGADMPQLTSAARRLKLGQALEVIKSKHLDLFQHAKKAVRFPIPTFALGEVATYLGIAMVSRIRDGLEAQLQYLEYRKSQDDAHALKAKLVEYNRDDLEAIVGIAERLVTYQWPSA